MQRITVDWLLIRPWPITSFFVLWIGFSLAGKYFKNHRESIFSNGRKLLELIGVLLLLLTLNDNLQAYKGSSLKSMIKEWAMEPFVSKSATVIVSGVEIRAEGGEVFAYGGGRENLPIERRIKMLEDDTLRIDKQFWEYRQLMKKQMKESSDQITAKTDEIHGRVKRVEQRFEDAMIGDYKVQIFGILLVILGVILEFQMRT